MTVPPEISWSLEIGSGVLWTLVYILIVRVGFRDKTYGMPIAALSANISWRFIFSFIYHHEPPQNYVNTIWFAFDLAIVYQTLRFGKAVFGRDFPSRLFYPAFSLALMVSFFAVLAVTVESRIGTASTPPSDKTS